MSKIYKITKMYGGRENRQIHIRNKPWSGQNKTKLNKYMKTRDGMKFAIFFRLYGAETDIKYSRKSRGERKHKS